jgi:hypothetical protein
MANERERGPFLTVMALLMALLTLSNFTKPIQYHRQPDHLGIVIFGVRHLGVFSNLIFGWLMGAFVGTYAWGIWNLRRWVVPISIIYAFYVPLNLVLFWWAQTGPDIPPLRFMLTYLAFALTGSIGTALYLAYHRDKLA